MAVARLNARKRKSDGRPLLTRVALAWISSVVRLGQRLTKKISVLVLIVLIDGGLTALAWTLAYVARFDLGLPASERSTYAFSLVVVTTLQAAVNWYYRLARGMWSTSGLNDAILIVKAALTGATVSASVLLLITRFDGVPRSSLVVYPALLVLLCGGARAAYRAETDRERRASRKRLKALVVGDMGSISTVVNELAVNAKLDLVGLVRSSLDREPGRQINGLPILGSIADLPAVLHQHRPEAVILTLSRREPSTVRTVAGACTAADVQLYLVPESTAKLGSPVTSRMRELQLEDFLQRNIASLIDESFVRAKIRGRCVVVTGGAGSIGFELSKQVASYGPRRLVILDSSEYNLYRALERLAEIAPHIDVRPVLGDVARNALVERTFRELRPDVVFHAAAYKHVPLLESQPIAAVRTNVIGTFNVARAAAANNVDTFVLISTDKAVEPSSVMGATKRLAELLIGDFNRTSNTKFIAVRFGNVLESSGSVVPKFREQIASGGPVTVTHPDMVRFFMTITEACELILQGTAIGEKNDVLVLDMGQPIRVAELARQLIQLSGDGSEVKIVYTGLRPGEKLSEELFYDDEYLLPTRHPLIRRATRATSSPDMEFLVDELSAACHAEDDRRVIEILLGHMPHLLVPMIDLTDVELLTRTEVDARA